MITADRVKEHITRHLKWDSSLKGSQIKVDYVGRIAILEGTVPSLLAHSMAQRDALSIPGVDSVENRLVVKFSHSHVDKSDADVRLSIRNILDCTLGSQGSRIEVLVENGIVTLRGDIDSYWQKARVEDLASSADGVMEIKNKIRVVPADKAPDSAIRKEIILALERMMVKGLEKLEVGVKDGVVTLSGSVPTWDTAFDVEDTARYTGGVTDVKNKLTVE